MQAQKGPALTGLVERAGGAKKQRVWPQHYTNIILFGWTAANNGAGISPMARRLRIEEEERPARCHKAFGNG